MSVFQHLITVFIAVMVRTNLLLSIFFLLSPLTDCKEITLSVAGDNKTTEIDLQNIEAVKADNNKTNKSISIPDLSTFCQSFQSCSECVSNMIHPCYWCHNYGCTDKAESLCPETIEKIKKINMNMNLCPYITHEGAILVPAGMRANLKVKLHAPDPVIYDKEIICQIHFKQSLTHLKGIIMNDIIYCYPVVLNSAERRATNTGYLKIIWGGISPISNGIPVSVYNCEDLADDCKNCRLIPVEYGCGWCDKIKKCVVADKCDSSLTKWTLNRLECSYDRQLIYV